MRFFHECCFFAANINCKAPGKPEECIVGMYMPRIIYGLCSETGRRGEGSETASNYLSSLLLEEKKQCLETEERGGRAPGWLERSLPLTSDDFAKTNVNPHFSAYSFFSLFFSLFLLYAFYDAKWTTPKGGGAGECRGGKWW